jgi:hypothetical protein
LDNYKPNYCFLKFSVDKPSEILLFKEIKDDAGKVASPKRLFGEELTFS